MCLMGIIVILYFNVAQGQVNPPPQGNSIHPRRDNRYTGKCFIVTGIIINVIPK